MTVARYWFEEYSDDELYARLTQRGVSAEMARLWVDNRDADDGDDYVDEIAYVLEGRHERDGGTVRFWRP